MHVWALGLSCETPAAPPDRAARARTRQPENSKRAHLSAPALQTPPTFHEKTPREGRKERILRRDREKKSAKFWAPHPSAPDPSGPHPSGPHPWGPTFSGFGPPPFGAPPFGAPPFGASTLRGLHPSGPPPFGAHPSGPHPSGPHPSGPHPFPHPHVNSKHTKKPKQLISKNPNN